MIDGDFDFNPDANHAKSVQRVLQPLLFRDALGGCKRSGIGILKRKAVPEEGWGAERLHPNFQTDIALHRSQER